MANKLLLSCQGVRIFDTWQLYIRVGFYPVNLLWDQVEQAVSEHSQIELVLIIDVALSGIHHRLLLLIIHDRYDIRTIEVTLFGIAEYFL